MYSPLMAAAPKVVFNWPPGADEVKTKHVKVTFTYSVIPPGRGSTPEPEKGWGRKYRRAPLPTPPSKGASSSPAKVMNSATQSPPTKDPAPVAAPAVAGTPGGGGGGRDEARPEGASDEGTLQPHSALDRKPASQAATPASDAAEASAIGAGVAVTAASAGGASDTKSKAGKQAVKSVQFLDPLLKVWGEVEVFTVGDWWNARIDKIVTEKSKTARISVSYEQSPGVYGVMPGDEVELVIRQADGIWAYAQQLRHRQPEKPGLLDAAGVGGAGGEAAAGGGTAIAPAPAPPPPAAIAIVKNAAPISNVKRELTMPVKRELMMPGPPTVVAVGLVEGLHMGLQMGVTPPAPLSHAEEDGGNLEAVKEPRWGYYPGHPCYWPLFYTRTDGTKLILTKLKPYPHAYKRVRVRHGSDGDSGNPCNSWTRDLDKEIQEREERRRMGQLSPSLDVDSNKSSPMVASPNNAPPVLSHVGAAPASSGGMLLAPQVVRVGSSDKGSENMANGGDAPRAAHAQDVTSHAQDVTSRVSPSVSPTLEQEATEQAAGEQAALRLKALHALALEDLTKAELKGKLNAKVPKQMLKELARRVETPGDADKEACKYKLKPALWLEVQMDTWSEYSQDDRSVLAIRLARAKEEGAGTLSTARSPADAPASRSPVNQDAAADDKKAPKGHDAGSRGGALRGAGRQGSAFEDVKGGVRSDSAAAPPSKSPPSHELSDNENGMQNGMQIAHKTTLEGTASNKSSSPTDGKQVEASCKTREAAIPRKRARDSSEVSCSEPSSKEARKSEASSSTLPSHALPPGDKDMDRGRESERQGDGRKARTDSSDSPGLMLSPFPLRNPLDDFCATTPCCPCMDASERGTGLQTPMQV